MRRRRSRVERFAGWKRSWRIKVMKKGAVHSNRAFLFLRDMPGVCSGCDSR
jgi:hypothetical protein